MGRGSEGHAGENESPHERSRTTMVHSKRLTEEHDEASRAVQRRRSGSRFRYRRKGYALHHLRSVNDAHFHEYVSAALRRTLVLVCVQITLGTFASGPDTGSDRTSARTAVVQMSYISSSISYLHTSPHGSSADVLRPATLDLITANTGFRHAKFCYARPWPASDRASLPLPQPLICPRLPSVTPSPSAVRPSLPMARQLHRAPPIANDRPPARPDRPVSNSLPASQRPAAPPACRPTCPGRLAWTRPLLCRAAQRLHASKPCHAGSHGTRQKYHLEENSNKKSPILRCNNAFEELDGYACASASCMAPALPSRPSLRTSSRPSSRAPSRTSSGAPSVHQQIASPLARAGLKTAINVVHHA
jgi:hypothetical protein